MKKSSPVNRSRSTLVGAVALLGVAIASGAYFVAKSVSADTSPTIMPSSDGAFQEWTRAPLGGAQYTAIDESACNGLTDSVRTSSVGTRTSFGVSLASIPNGAYISGVTVTPCASRNNSAAGGSSVMNTFVRWNGSNSRDRGNYSLTGITPANLPSVTFGAAMSMFAEVGFRSYADLVKNDQSALEVGAVLTSGDRGARVSRLAVSIIYILPPVAPTNLVATAAAGTSTINLVWSQTSTNENGFTVERSLDGTTFVEVANLGMNATSYAATNLTRGTYYFRVKATNVAGSSAYTNVAQAMSDASALAADLLVNPGFQDTAWVWCETTPCTRSMRVQIQNVGHLNTISHLYVGELSGSNIELVQVDRVDESGNVITPNVTFTSSTHISYGSRYPWSKSWRVAQQPINSNRSLYYRMTYRFTNPPGIDGYYGDRYTFEVMPATGHIEATPLTNNERSFSLSF